MYRLGSLACAAARETPDSVSSLVAVIGYLIDRIQIGDARAENVFIRLVEDVLPHLDGERRDLTAECMRDLKRMTGRLND